MSIFPFMQQATNTEDVKADLPLYMEYAYDFQNNRLLLDEHKHTYLVSGNQALKIWIYKALKTERFNYLTYTLSFGNEAPSLIGSTIDYEIMISEIKRYITEALYFNDYILEIRDFVFERMDAGISVGFEVSTIYGLLQITYEEGGNHHV